MQSNYGEEGSALADLEPDLDDEETLGLLECLLEDRLSWDCARLREREALLFKLLICLGDILQDLSLLELFLGDGETLRE